uniref:Uncharacterized protein n=1 Tax=Arundo donax TaxID=35708 RepID=A0A0A9FPZ8_ARUDO
MKIANCSTTLSMWQRSSRQFLFLCSSLCSCHI